MIACRPRRRQPWQCSRVRAAAILLWIVALVTARNLVAQAEASMQDSIRFPAVSGRSLANRTFRLPGDFEGELNVVLVAFQRHQQADVDTWTPHVKALAARYPGLRIYELPTLGRRWLLMRPVIDGGMRGGIPDSAVRAATITLYINKSPFRTALGITDENRIHVLLVDRAGGVLWRAEGPWHEGAADGLEQRLEAAGRSGGR